MAALAGEVVFFVCIFCLSILSNSTGQLESINSGQSLRDGETLVSRSRIYELGFFRLADLENRYLGIWFMNINPRTVVWVANREVPLSNTMGALNVTSQGFLLINGTNNIIWSSNVSRTAQNPVAELLDSGNFVLRDEANVSNTILWQSFDYPSDTILPGMKIGINLQTGFETYFTSWKSIEDPSPGEFSVHMDGRGYPQVVLKRRNQIYYRGGSWNGITLTGTPAFKDTQIFSPEFVINRDEIYFKFDIEGNSPLIRVIINPSGVVQLLSWTNKSEDWSLLAASKSDHCDNYGQCGVFGSCDVFSSMVCACLDGFTPKSPAKWDSGDWSDGCGRRIPLECNNKDTFQKISGIKLPDTSSSRYNESMSLEECNELCAKTCSCTAYANIDVSKGGSGCLLWFDEIIDLRKLTENGQELYIKLAPSEIDKKGRKRFFIKRKEGAAAVVSCVIFAAVLMVGTITYICWKRAKDESSEEVMEMPILDLTTIANATDNFSSSNKIGEGGFGPVYKGTLKDGQEVAVKRLSKSSGQGMNEFKTEIMLIAKLQHRNLVKLLGCCIHKDEKMLVYEYMPNKSLDFFIFDQTRCELLEWPARFNIIGGVARGLLYLHQDSRLRIIHRDLKASNVLLDSDMNPKISDFGLARTFGGDQSGANTNRVVGTYGYMSPEYAMDGHFSVKSDVFSFGVLVMETISGKKNRGFFHPDHSQNLLGHAWMLWTEKRPLQLIDDNLNGRYDRNEVLRSIQVSLLCVQQRPEDRPNMSSVVGMLGGENPLPEPKQPGFYLRNNSTQGENTLKNQFHSSNVLSVTQLEAR